MGASQKRLSALLRSRFVSAYYVANFLVLASYAVLRPLVDLAADSTTRAQLKSFVRQQRGAPGRSMTQFSPSHALFTGAPRLGCSGLQLHPQGVGFGRSWDTPPPLTTTPPPLPRSRAAVHEVPLD